MIAFRLGRWGAAILLLWAIAAVNVFWVGRATIYSPGLEARRESLHRAVLSGDLPEGVRTWDEIGANSSALRPAVPWVAERIATATGLPLGLAYQLIEFAAILGAIAALFLVLRRWVPAERAVLGCLYLGVVLPLSYFSHYFHPWDKPALALWLAAAALMLADAVVPAALVIGLAVLVKFDAVVLPALYMLVHARRTKARAFAPRAALLWLAAIAPFLLLRWMRPDAAEPRELVPQLVANIQVFRETWYAYPPLIAFLLPVSLGALGWTDSTRAERALYGFALGVLGILAATTNFVEVRAELAPLALLLPCALRGFERLAGRPDGAPRMAA